MGGLSFLTTGGAPPSETTNTAAQRTLPDWYNSYIQGIANKAGSIAGQPYTPYPGQKVADFNDDQQSAFDKVRAQQGAYAPGMTQAAGAITGAMPRVTSNLAGSADAATGAGANVAGPAQSWTAPGVADQYMSPYTKNVTDEIGRLGNRNLTENIMPAVGSQFVGSGQFGSTRGTDALGRTVRDTQRDITGQQSLALQHGYDTSSGIFANDANRTQQQGALQAQTALGTAGALTSGAGTAANAGTAMGSGLGALTQMNQGMGYTDANAMSGIGGQQQALEQKGYDTSLDEFNRQRDWDWTQLGRVQGAVNGVQLPTGVTQSTNAPVPGASGAASPLQWASALGSMYKSFNDPGPATANPVISD